MSSAELEQKFVSIVRQYQGGFFGIPADIKAALRELADFMQWDELKQLL